ncbi:hypothetical protein F5Y06DRAFT_307612 [Hypoxylon sp. FL0890]|nr:hypothetical protein F5Y06DRAFT_307612 [Hypoxylon sp. FL0890]
MPHRSRSLLQLYSKRPQSPVSSKFPPWGAANDSPALHRRRRAFPSPLQYLYHKLQAIRFVTGQLAHPDAVVHDGTIAAVSSLALVENALGSVDAVSSHLRGLAKIRELQGEDTRPKEMGLLQRMILMAARSISSRPVCGILDISRMDFVHHLAMLGDSYHSEEPLSEVLARKAPHVRASDSNVLTPPRSVDSSRTGFIACYFYLYRAVTGGLMFGACATMAAKTIHDLETGQFKVIRDVYLDKISLVSQLLRIKD